MQLRFSPVDKDGQTVTLQPSKYYVMDRQGALTQYDTIELALANATQNDVVLAGSKTDLRAVEALSRNVSILAANKVDRDQVYIKSQMADRVELNAILANYGMYSGPVPIASDGGVDWYGEVSAEELISGNALASLIGLTAGTAQHSDAGWLHVGLDGTELLIAKRPLRYNLSWNSINAVNAVYGNRTVEINGQLYKVRLPKGANSDPASTDTGYDALSTHGSEWNRIFYRLTNETYIDARNTKASEEPFIHLAQYSEADLILHSGFGNGTQNWCQESIGAGRVIRGYVGVSLLAGHNHSTTSSYYGWRPVLEKVA